MAPVATDPTTATFGSPKAKATTVSREVAAAISQYSIAGGPLDREFELDRPRYPVSPFTGG